MAPKFGHSPGMEARFARRALGMENGGVSYWRNVEAGPDGLVFVAFGAPLIDPSDSEMKPAWWSD